MTREQLDALREYTKRGSVNISFPTEDYQRLKNDAHVRLFIDKVPDWYIALRDAAEEARDELAGWIDAMESHPSAALRELDKALEVQP